MIPAIADEASSSLLLEYCDIFRRSKAGLALMAFLGLVTSLLITLPQTPVYQARATLEIQSLNNNFLNMGNVNPTANDAGSSYPEIDLGTQVKVLQSESVLERVAAKLDRDNKTYSESKLTRPAVWRKFLGLAPSKPTSAGDAVSAERLQVHIEPNTRLIRILYDSADPQFAADVVNAVTSEFIQKNLEDRGQTTQQTGKWLARQMQDVRVNLEKSEDELQNYANASGLVFTSEKDNAAEQTFKQVQEELDKAKADRIAKQSQYELALTAPADSLPEVVDDPTLKEYQVKTTDLRRQLAELSSSLTPSHPAVAKVQAQVASLELALERKRTSIIDRIQNEFKSAQRRESLLAATYALQARTMSAQAAKVSHYDILKREVDTNRQLYESMLRSVQQASMTSALSASNIRIVDTAKPPGGPYKPNLFLNSLVGTFVGGFVGMIVVVVRERIERNIQDPGETKLYLDVPELGVIPSRDGQSSRHFPYVHRRKGSSILEGHTAKQIELITVDDCSFLAEAYRATVTSLLYCGENGDRPRVVVVTSANPGEGKTTTASNLALAAAEIGAPVLLIDGDLRKGRLSELFQTSNQWGLNELLQGKQAPENRASLILATSYKHLYLLPSGSASPNVSALLHSPRLEYLLDRVRQEFSMVIIDTPPMLHLTDARLFGRLADGVLLVVRAAQTSRSAAAAASQRLIEDKTRVLGTVLNEWNPADARFYGYSGPYRYGRAANQ